ncbi:MAG: S49 family peptidase [Waddliaceae bacterium]
MEPSIIRSSLRSFFSAISSIIGIGMGIILVVLVIASLTRLSDDKLEIKSHFSPTIVANEKDVRKALSKKAPVILKINIGGLIGTDKLNMHTVQQQLTESREGKLKKNRVKALLIHINSPGGTVVDADGIYLALKEYKERYEVPVFAYVDGLCASGGMYIASAADKIFASDISLIGSIGVLSPPFFNVTKLMEKVGVEAKTLFAGKGKEDLNPFRPWKPGEEESLKSIIDYYYNHFVDIVTSNRPKIKRDLLIDEYGAHVFPAPKALEYGLIDGIEHSLNDAIKLVAKEIDIEDKYYQVIKMDRKLWLSELLKDDSPMMTGELKHRLELTPELDSRLMNQFLYLYMPGHPSPGT